MPAGVTATVTPYRRRTDNNGGAANRTARRVIAEEAYRLFVELGGDPRSTSACWQAAEAHHSAYATISRVVPAVLGPLSTKRT
jgi:guanyl-specific ribonuclease Sa